MRHTLIALLPWMVTAWGWAQERQASVRYTHLGAFEKEAVRFGDECFVPISTAGKWGWRVNVTEGMADVQAEGRLVKVVARAHNGQVTIPLVQSLQQLGARFEWVDDTTLSVRGVIRNVVIQRDRLRIDATMAFSPRLVRESGKIGIEMTGVWMDPKVKFDLPAGVSLRQVQTDVVRLTIEKPGIDGAILPSLSPGRTLDFALDGVVLRDPDPTPLKGSPQEKPDPASFAPRRNDVTPPTEDTATDSANQVQEQPIPPPAPVAALGPPSFTSEAEDRTILAIPLTGTLPNRPTAAYSGPTTVVVTIPGAAPPTDEPGRSKFVNAIGISDDGKGNAVITIDLKRAMAFELGIEGGAVRLKLIRPKASGKLTGKVIVVDAGHGGHDSGATGGGVLEKNLTISIARLLAKELTAQGASVIMTRSDDTFIPLRERPGIANRSRADFFISVHINSNNVANKTSGQISFYHMQDPMGILLAECIETEMTKVSGLPSLGTWSDSRIYKNGGFAVLKYATMPAVLLELGFINHDTDRAAMKTAKFQQDISRAIVRGVKTYLGGTGGE